MNGNIPFCNEFFIGLDFWTLTCVMMVYSFIGWFYESTIFSIVEQGKIMNRGCFVGPYCPIYSVVSILNLYLLNEITSPFKIIFISSLTCCVVEYVTSYVLEKIFHARYWDYSYFPLNINGRISVISGLFFGFAVLLLIKAVHPITLYMVLKLSLKARYYISIILWTIFIFDVLFTTVGMLNLNRKCKELYDAWDNIVEQKLDKINSKKELLDKYVVVVKGKNLVVKLKDVNRKFVDIETRYLKNNPAFKSTKYNEIIEKMKDVLGTKSHDFFSRHNLNSVDDDTNIDVDSNNVNKDNNKDNNININNNINNGFNTNTDKGLIDSHSEFETNQNIANDTINTNMQNDDGDKKVSLGTFDQNSLNNIIDEYIDEDN